MQSASMFMFFKNIHFSNTFKTPASWPLMSRLCYYSLLLMIASTLKPRPFFTTSKSQKPKCHAIFSSEVSNWQLIVQLAANVPSS